MWKTESALIFILHITSLDLIRIQFDQKKFSTWYVVCVSAIYINKPISHKISVNSIIACDVQIKRINQPATISRHVYTFTCGTEYAITCEQKCASVIKNLWRCQFHAPLFSICIYRYTYIPLPFYNFYVLNNCTVINFKRFCIHALDFRDNIFGIGSSVRQSLVQKCSKFINNNISWYKP